MAAPAMIAMMAISAAMSAATAIMSAQAQSRAAKYNAAIADRNAVIARQQAEAESKTQQQDATRRIGAARAAYGAAGVDAEGSPLDVLEEAAILSESDRQAILYRGELRALGYQDSARLDRMQASSATTAGYMKAGSALLAGASNIGSRMTSTPSVPDWNPGADSLGFSVR